LFLSELRCKNTLGEILTSLFLSSI